MNNPGGEPLRRPYDADAGIEHPGSNELRRPKTTDPWNPGPHRSYCDVVSGAHVLHQPLNAQHLEPSMGFQPTFPINGPVLPTLQQVIPAQQYIHHSMQMEQPAMSNIQVFHPNALAHHTLLKPFSALSVNAAEFVPKTFQDYSQVEPSYPQEIADNGEADEADNGEADEPDIEDHPAVIDLRQAMFTLTINPGIFDARVPTLLSTFNSTITDEVTLKAVIDIIFEQSIVEPNFRYTGARVCDYLHKNLKLNLPSESFRAFLLQRCQNEYRLVKETTSNSKDDRLRLQGLVMFLAEVYTNMEIVVDGKSQKIEKIGDVLPILILSLSSAHMNDSNFKCLCQVVKLCGASLEEQEREKSSNGSTPKMDSLFDVIKEHSSSLKLNSITREMLTKVLNLRASDWGKNPLSPEVQENKCDSPPADPGPIFYGPDGKPLSKEEDLFLNSNNQTNTDEESEGCDSGDYPNGMNEEMYEAYEEFLAQSGVPE